MKMKKVILIIPTYNHNEDLFKCLSSLNESIGSRKWNIRTIVIDDGSSKSSRDELISNIIKFGMYKNVNPKLMFLKKNQGFMKCCNIGLRSIIDSGKLPEYVGFLHDDVEVRAEWLDRLTKELDSDISVYAASSMSLNKLDIHNVFSLGIKEIDENLSEDDLISILDSSIKDEMTFEANEFQMFATLFKMDAFTKYGIFDDENVSSINLEFEFAKRLINNNRKIKILSTAYVHHKSRMSSNENPNQLTYSKMIGATNWINHINNELTPKKYAIYTFVRSNESLPKMPGFDDSYEYVCFTSNESLYAKRGLNFPWKIFNVDEISDFLGFLKDSIKMKEFIKMSPHLLLKKIGISIWIDSKYDALKDLTDVSKMMNPKNFLLALDDPAFSCLYRKLIDVKSKMYVTEQEFNDVLQVYKWCRYPQENGVMNTSLLIRKHNDERCKIVMNKVWNFIQNTYPNDELFMNFVMWLNKYDYSYVPMNLALNEYIKTKEDING